MKRGTGLIHETHPKMALYRTADVIDPQPNTFKMWRMGPVLDQGRIGACAAFAWVGELLAAPKGAFKIDPKIANEYGMNQWRRARYLSGWNPYPKDGESEGSTLVRNAQACVERGLIEEYRWAMSVEEVRDAVIAEGPVVISIPWYRSLEQTNAAGYMRVDTTGTTRGGHALVITGYDPNKTIEVVTATKRRKAKLYTGPMFRVRNSWGNGWGEATKRKWGWVTKRSGTGWLKIEDLERLVVSHHGWTGSAVIPMGRKPFDLEALLKMYPNPTIPPNEWDA